MIHALDSVLCNVPWVEVHIDADGSYGTCGAQSQTKRLAMMTPGERQKYNVVNMTIDDWVNSEYQNKVRLNMTNGISETLCEMCYHEEEVSGQSKRTRELTKSNIEYINFYPTLATSPDKKYFTHAKDNNGACSYGKPNSFHISLGNECNMACKMCSPRCSSAIAAIQKKQGIYSGPIIMSWSTNETVWNQVVDYIVNDENLQFVHIIGGEPLINHRFENLIDRLLAANKTDIYFGFTTNGTIVSDIINQKLLRFRYVDIGISIETATELNDFIRQGSNIDSLLSAIKKYLVYRDKLTITIRPVPSALSVHGLDSLYKWCIENKVDVMTNILTFPEHLQIRHLPPDVKNRLLDQYSQRQFSEPDPSPAHHRAYYRFKEHIDTSVRGVIAALNLENNPEMTKKLYSELSVWGWLNNDITKGYFL